MTHIPPILVYNFPVETTDNDIEQYLASTERLLARRIMHVKINNMLVNKISTAKQRLMVADWIAGHLEALKLYRVAFALVASEPTAGMVRAVAWRTPYPYPWEIFDSMPPAMIWSCQRLKERGLELPAKLRGQFTL